MRLARAGEVQEAKAVHPEEDGGLRQDLGRQLSSWSKGVMAVVALSLDVATHRLALLDALVPIRHEILFLHAAVVCFAWEVPPAAKAPPS